MPKKRTNPVREVPLSKFNRTVFVDRMSNLHQVLEIIEDDALRLPKVDMYEIYLMMFSLHNDAKKVRYATREILEQGGVE